MYPHMLITYTPKGELSNIELFVSQEMALARILKLESAARCVETLGNMQKWEAPNGRRFEFYPIHVQGT